MADPKKRRRRVKVLLAEQRRVCFWCFRTCARHGSRTPARATIDHVFPRGLRPVPAGGRDDMTFVTVLACHACNQARGDVWGAVLASIASRKAEIIGGPLPSRYFA
jgi:hypothetical protein